MSLVTILLFFIYSWGLGYSATGWMKSSENFLERNIMRVAFGLGIIPILAALLNLLHIPLDWRIFLAISLIIPIVYSFKNVKNFNFKLTKSDFYFFIVLVIFFITFFMYYKGSFSYPWMEDGDAWEYATSARHIAVEKTFSKDKGIYISHYSEPYTIGYSVLMGILHQTSPSIKWTLKFFNVMLLSLNILFFYFFAKKFMKNRKMALFATFVLFAIPSFNSHFIFAQQLAITLFFPALYALEAIIDDKKWVFISAIMISSILITQFNSAAALGFLFLPVYWLIKVITNKRLEKEIIFAIILGLILSFIYWGPMIIKYSLDRVTPWEKGDTFYRVGTENIHYKGAFQDFFYAMDVWPYKGSGNKINTPVGTGIILSSLFIASMLLIILRAKKLYIKKQDWIIIAMLWSLLNFLNVLGNPFFALNPHRSWPFFGLSVAIVVGYGFIKFLDFIVKENISRFAVTSIIIILILFTSFKSKYIVNTVMWPQDQFHPFIGYEGYELPGYMFLETLPIGTWVTSLCREDHGVIGWDKASNAEWDREMIAFRDQYTNKSSQEINQLLKNKGYEYVITDYRCIEKFGQNETIAKLNEIVSSNLFMPVYQTEFQGQKTLTIVFKVV